MGNGNDEIISGMKNILDLFEKKGISRELLEEWLASHIQSIRMKDDFRWRKEISKRLPSIDFMSFAGAESTMNWVFDKVEIKNEMEGSEKGSQPDLKSGPTSNG